MKKHLLAAGAVLALTAAPAAGQNANLNVNLEGEIAAQCGVFMYSGLVGLESQPDTPGDDLGPRGLGGTWAENGTLGIDLGALTSAASYTLGSFAAICNTQNASVSVDTVNGFELQNGGDAIPFDLNISGGPGTFDTPTSYTAGGANPPGGNTRTVSMTLDSYDTFSQAPGTYTDTVTFTVAPAP